MKQATLFRSWAREKGQKNVRLTSDTTDQGCLVVVNSDSRIDCDLGSDVGSELVDGLEDFFVDDITDELVNDCVPLDSANCLSSRKKSLNASLYEEIPGFDMESGTKFIYPTNFPVRDYQFNMVKKSLFKNTLISLPTGLGKTFIAAVLMYNYYRWYPNRKIVFLAPTKPLVAQQIEACFRIMGMSWYAFV